MDRRPIGIFDSGLGGLTAAKALEALLPGEDLVYFGDSANVPYGTKTRAQLRTLAFANAAFLSGFDVKAVLVGCGTVSSTVLGALREHFPQPFFGVVEAACRAAVARAHHGRIAVIATEATIASGAYARRIAELDARAAVFSKACQSLVRTVEAGHFRPGDAEGARAVAEELAPVREFQPDVLILACTHFPLLREQIAAFLGAQTQLLSVSEEAAKELADYLRAQDLLSDQTRGAHRWYTSGDAAAFDENAALFLGHGVKSQTHENGARQ